MTPVHQIGPLIPWACTYYKGGLRYGITLYATDPEQIVIDHKNDLPGLTVEGRVVGTVER